MDDPGLAWPAWKFGMKRDDLFTTLHDRYNTLTYTLQDPEAFHHDVYEASQDADTPDEFHRLMADRQRQRVQELHESLESLAVEIIANPKLMASEQWQHALQLFRTKSFDSIVRFFASYIPSDYHDDSHSHSTTSFSFSDVNDTVHTPISAACSADEAPCSSYVSDDFLPKTTDKSYSTQAKVEIDLGFDAPLSPPQSESESEPEASDADSPRAYTSSNPPSRSMSFSGSESGHIDADLIRRSLVRDDDETSQSDDCDTAVTSVCDSSECRSSFDPADKEPLFHVVDSDADDDVPTTQYPEDDFDTLDMFDTINDTLDSDTATPKASVNNDTCYMEYKPAVSRSLTSPHRRSNSPKSHLARHKEDSLLRRSSLREVRRSPEEALSKIQKPSTESIRKRPLARTRID